MKTKKKQKQTAGRSALMASLIVAAITGVTPAFAAADNLSLSSTPNDAVVAAPTGGAVGTYLATPNVTIGKKLTVQNLGRLHVGKGSDLQKAQQSTLTVDNMSIEKGGEIEVSNNSTLNIKQKNPLVMGELKLDNGTVNIASGTGTLYVAGKEAADNGRLHAKGGVNTINGSVHLGASNQAPEATGKGTLFVNNGAKLTITENLTVLNGSNADVGGTVEGNATTGTLVVKKQTIGDGTITITAGSQMTANKDSVAGADKTFTGTLTNNGILYLNMTGEYLAGAEAALGLGTVHFLGGTLVGTAGGPALDVTVNATTDSIALGNKAVLADSSTAITATIGAKTLEVTTGDQVKVDSGTLQLTGGNGVDLIGGTAAGKAVTIATGTLELGIAGGLNQGGKLAGIEMTGDGTVNVTDGHFTMDSLKASDGVITVQNESNEKGTSFTSQTTELSGNVELKVLNSTANLGKLTASGGSIFIDPAIVTIDTIVGGNTATEIVVGAGGNVVIGDTKADWMLAAMKNVGVASLDSATSVLAVRETVTLATGGQIYLDPTAGDATSSSTHDLTFNNGSLVIADMAKLNGGPIFDITNGDTKKAFIADDAKLYLSDLKFGNNGITLIEGATDIEGGTNETGWTGENLINHDNMLNAGIADDGTLTVAVKKASDVMPELTSEMNGLMDEVWRGDLNSVNSANAGIKLVSRAANNKYMTPAEGARAVEGVARMAVLGATQQMAFATSNAATAAATQRTSMANPMANSSGTLTALVREEGSQQWKAENSGLSAGNGMKNGAALWIMPLYQNMNAWNMKADNFHTGYSANFGGVALGGDYTFADAFRLGLALNIGGGFSESNGDFAKTENKFNFWGINLYGGWAQNNLAVTADVGYTSTFNDVKQDSTPGLGMSEFKTDMYSHAITAGLRGEYKVQTEYVDIIPHIAARYTNLHSDDYKIKSGGETVFKGEAIDQSIWTFPIGVAFSKDVEMSNGWTFKPQVDLAVIPAAGDIAAKTKVKIPGHSVTADLESNIVDGISYQGALGFDMYKDNIAFGLNYTIQASEHTTGHGVQATIRYEF